MFQDKFCWKKNMQHETDLGTTTEYASHPKHPTAMLDHRCTSGQMITVLWDLDSAFRVDSSVSVFVLVFLVAHNKINDKIKSDCTYCPKL